MLSGFREGQPHAAHAPPLQRQCCPRYQALRLARRIRLGNSWGGPQRRPPRASGRHGRAPAARRLCTPCFRPRCPGRPACPHPRGSIRGAGRCRRRRRAAVQGAAQLRACGQCGAPGRCTARWRLRAVGQSSAGPCGEDAAAHDLAPAVAQRALEAAAVAERDGRGRLRIGCGGRQQLHVLRQPERGAALVARLRVLAHRPAPARTRLLLSCDSVCLLLTRA